MSNPSSAAKKIFRSSPPSSSSAAPTPLTPTSSGSSGSSLLSTLTTLGRRSTSERSNSTLHAGVNSSGAAHTAPSSPVNGSMPGTPVLSGIGLVGQSYVEKVALELAEKGNKIFGRGGAVERERAKEFAATVERLALPRQVN
ncbi:hypothetical protein BT69DRAFT_698784 [Atractiella rhizophila]|nr:hypothetical protein BT69DRAFT_698784 [Atractiella rhizophila]